MYHPALPVYQVGGCGIGYREHDITREKAFGADGQPPWDMEAKYIAVLHGSNRAIGVYFTASGKQHRRADQGRVNKKFFHRDGNHWHHIVLVDKTVKFRAAACMLHQARDIKGAKMMTVDENRSLLSKMQGNLSGHTSMYD